MNNAKQNKRSKNVIKTIIFSIVIFLFVFLTLAISALLLGFLSEVSLKVTFAAALILRLLDSLYY